MLMRRRTVVLVTAVAVVAALVVTGDAAAATPAHGKSKGGGNSGSKANSLVCSSVPKCSNLCPYLTNEEQGCDLLTTTSYVQRNNEYHQPVLVRAHTTFDGTTGDCTHTIVNAVPAPTPISVGCEVDLEESPNTAVALAMCPDGYAVLQQDCHVVDSPQMPQSTVVNLRFGGCSFPMPAQGSELTVSHWFMCVRIGHFGDGIFVPRAEVGSGDKEDLAQMWREARRA